ncbi:MAG TPA: PaaI family thioesterase [Bryobacteraceae bacterium]|nr:PaaI family thioesterase [Bryobacteraceae bacterium]
MSVFIPKDPSFESRVRGIFADQSAMRTIGASIESIEPGAVRLRMPFRAEFAQQHGYMHAAISTMLVDTACGCAAITLAAPGYNVLTVEYKVNFLNPGEGHTFIATGRVVKPGRTLTVCSGEVIALRDGGVSGDIASMLTTMMFVQAQA